MKGNNPDIIAVTIYIKGKRKTVMKLNRSLFQFCRIQFYAENKYGISDNVYNY